MAPRSTSWSPSSRPARAITSMTTTRDSRPGTSEPTRTRSPPRWRSAARPSCTWPAEGATIMSRLVDLASIPPFEVWGETVRARKVEGERITLARGRAGAGIGVPEHRHPAEQLGICIEGEMTFTIGEADADVRPRRHLAHPVGRAARGDGRPGRRHRHRRLLARPRRLGVPDAGASADGLAPADHATASNSPRPPRPPRSPAPPGRQDRRLRDARRTASAGRRGAPRATGDGQRCSAAAAASDDEQPGRDAGVVPAGAGVDPGDGQSADGPGDEGDVVARTPGGRHGPFHAVNHTPQAHEPVSAGTTKGRGHAHAHAWSPARAIDAWC